MSKYHRLMLCSTFTFLVLTSGCYSRTRPKAKTPQRIGPASIVGQLVSHDELGLSVGFPTGWYVLSQEELETSTNQRIDTIGNDPQTKRNLQDSQRVGRPICIAIQTPLDGQAAGAQLAIAAEWVGADTSPETYLKHVISFVEKTSIKSEIGQIEANQKLGSLHAASLAMKSTIGSVKSDHVTYVSVTGDQAVIVSLTYTSEDQRAALEEIRKTIKLVPK